MRGRHQRWRTGSAGIRFPISWFSVKRAGEFAAKFAKENSLGKIDNEKIVTAARSVVEPFERRNGENAYEVQRTLQEAMQDLVGIVRNKDECAALSIRSTISEPAPITPGVTGIGIQSRLHTALDLKNLLTVSQAMAARSIGREKKVAAPNSAKITQKKTTVFPR